MSLIGGFVPVVLHDPGQRAGDARRRPFDRRAVRRRRGDDVRHGRGGRSSLVAAIRAVGAAQWHHLVGMLGELDELCAEYGLTQALHPHVGTLVETAADVATVLERSDVRWCLDTGHLLIGGYDPAKFAVDAGDRVVHVHLKDVRRRGCRTRRRRRAVDPSGRGCRPVLSARRRVTRRSTRRSTPSRPPATPGGTCSSRTPISARQSRLPAPGRVEAARGATR